MLSSQRRFCALVGGEGDKVERRSREQASTRSESPSSLPIPLAANSSPHRFFALPGQLERKSYAGMAWLHLIRGVAHSNSVSYVPITFFPFKISFPFPLSQPKFDLLLPLKNDYIKLEAFSNYRVFHSHLTIHRPPCTNMHVNYLTESDCSN